MEHTIANKGKFLKIALIVTVLVFSIAFFANKLMKNSIKSKATDSCQAGLTCVNDTVCGPGGHCALGIDGASEIGRCLCSTTTEVGEAGQGQSDGVISMDGDICPVNQMIAPPEGCRYEGNNPGNGKCPGPPKLICDEGHVCDQDGICGDGQECIQPPMPVCSKDTACPQVMPQKICQLKEVQCPMMPIWDPPPGCRYEGSYPSTNGCPDRPRLICDEGRICNEDGICGDGQECYQPPMPICNGDLACPQVMPQRICHISKPLNCPLRPIKIPPAGCHYDVNKTLLPTDCPQYNLICDEGRNCKDDYTCGDGQECKSDCPPGSECFQFNLTCQSQSIKPCPVYDLASPPLGCRYEGNLPSTNNCPGDPKLICDEGRVCGQDGICGDGQECYQPPMPICNRNGDLACPQVMPAKLCRKKNTCPVFPPLDPGCEIVGDGGVDANGCMLPPQIKCPVNIADADGDGKVCLTDYNWLQNAFNGIYDSDSSDKKLKADFNKNKLIDDGDMVLFKKQYDPSKCGQGF